MDGNRPHREAAPMADIIAPPGKARVMTCPECKGAREPDCVSCHGNGRLLIRAYPQCGDIGWDYVNGNDDRGGMACRISCGYTWAAADPAWAAQVLPASP